eukprot:scaffold11.g3848.t1
MPEEVVDVLEDAGAASTMGLLYGFFSQTRVEMSSGPVQPPPNMPSEEAERVVRHIKSEQGKRILQAAFRHAARFGLLAAVFFSTETLGALARGGAKDVYACLAGGAVAGAAAGAGTTPFLRARKLPFAVTLLRLRAGILGAATGAALGAPAWLLLGTLRASLPSRRELKEMREQQQCAAEGGPRGDRKGDERKPGEWPARRTYDVTAEVIRQLEASLSVAAAREKDVGEAAQEEQHAAAGREQPAPDALAVGEPADAAGAQERRAAEEERSLPAQQWVAAPSAHTSSSGEEGQSSSLGGAPGGSDSWTWLPWNRQKR